MIEVPEELTYKDLEYCLWCKQAEPSRKRRAVNAYVEPMPQTRKNKLYVLCGACSKTYEKYREVHEPTQR